LFFSEEEIREQVGDLCREAERQREVWERGTGSREYI
jgi:hypothetical protein